MPGQGGTSTQRRSLMHGQVTLDHMRIFVAVGETRTYTEAAAALGIPVSKVSRAIQSIEKASRLRLVGRTDRSVTLTAAGHAYLVSCRQALAAVQASSDVLLAHRSEVEGLLRVGVPPVFARSVLIPLFPQLKRKYPRLRLALLLYTSEWDRFPAAEHDLLIKLRKPDESSRETRFHHKAFPSIRQGLFASPAYLARHTPIRSLDDLAAHRCIGYSTNAEINLWEGRYGGKQVRFDPAFDLVVSDAEMQLTMAQDGLGVALLPLWLAHADVVTGRLVPVLPDFEAEPILFNILHSGRARLSVKERVFLSFLDGIIATERDPRVQGQDPRAFFNLGVK